MASKQASPGWIIVFGLAFAVLGSIPGLIALHDLWTARAMRAWVETPATILQVELRHGDDTSAVECRYRYRAPDLAGLEAGRLVEFESDRVGVHSGSDNIGRWQTDTFARLQAAARQGRTVPCWYDPAKPSDAVLDRSERWGLIGFMALFPFVFGLVGGGLAWYGWRQRCQARMAAPDPRVMERQAMIPADRKDGRMLWIVTLVWNAIAWAAMIGVIGQGEAPWPVILLVALFPLIGLTLLWSAGLALLRDLRHGRPLLRLDDGTWTTGNRVQATVLTRTQPLPGDTLIARLAVLRRVTTSGEDGATSTQTVWSLDLAVDAQAGRSEGGIWAHHVELPLPSDVEATSDTVTWRLEWQVDRPGPDLSATFILPVVAGDGDPAALKGSDLRLAADRAAPLAVLRRAGIAVCEAGGEVVIEVPAWRNPSLHLSGLIASALFSAGAVAAWQWLGWWTGLLSGPILLLCWRGALRSALWRSTITLGPGRIGIAAGWWRLEHHQLDAAAVTAVERRSHMSSGETAWYNLWLMTGPDARLAIVRGVPGPAAERLATMLDLARGRPTSPAA